MNTQQLLIGALSSIGAIVFILGGLGLMVKKFYRKVAQGEALINNKTGDTTTVQFTGGLVLPIIHRAEVMDISLKTIELDRSGKDGLICADKIRADIKVTFFVRVNQTENDVKKVAQAIGCARASEDATLENLFLAKFSEALKTVGYSMVFEDLYRERDAFKDSILREIGTDLNGYTIDDAAIDYLEQTSIGDLDTENILDAEGIRAITAITAVKHVETNALQNEEKKRITKQNVETREAVLALEKQQASAEASQAREVANVRAREKAQIDKVNAEEYRRAEDAKIIAAEAIAVANENKAREVAVAQKNRERVVAVETERVEKDRQLEVITREREVELNRIEKDKLIEKERKEIADIVRGRVAVDKTVAEEEERIKDLRATAEANRNRDVTVIRAEGEAQEKLVKDIKAAEAQEKSATHLAKERLIMAEADLEAADKNAKATIRRSEGLQAEVAAPGLAEVKVKEADANAIEKRGFVEARIAKEKLSAIADGEEAKGLAAARVREAQATAAYQEGSTAAKVREEGMEAEARGAQEQGLAAARVKEADAAAVEKFGVAEAAAIAAKGTAEASATQEKMQAEAKGLFEKAEAMKQLDGVGREHEEFRLQLEKEKTVEIEGLHVQKDLAFAQAEVLGAAFKNAKFDIVGGDGAFFDRFVNAVAVGKSVDGGIGRSDTAQAMLKGYLNGEENVLKDVKEVLTRPALDSDAVQKLSVSAFLTSLIGGSADDEERGKLGRLAQAAKKLGLE